MALCRQLGTVQDGLNTIISDDYSFMAPMYNMVTAMQRDGIISWTMAKRARAASTIRACSRTARSRVPMGSWFIATLIAAENNGVFG